MKRFLWLLLAITLIQAAFPQAQPKASPTLAPSASAISAKTLDSRILFFTMSMSVLVGLVGSLNPAISAAKTNINILAKENSSRSGVGSQRSRWRPYLLILQVSLSLALLAGAGIMIRTFVAQRSANHRFDESHIVVLKMSLSIVSLIFGIKTWDPMMLLLVILLSCVVSSFAAYGPSMRVSRMNPAAAMRQ